ncbi:MAG: hypothetical protein IJ637_04980, partial [Prevotella sp.]|nr:hypothetical protein [Prevotella sp.]
MMPSPPCFIHLSTALLFILFPAHWFLSHCLKKLSGHLRAAIKIIIFAARFSITITNLTLFNMMRKFTKLMLTMALLIVGVGGVNARDFYATLSSGSTNGAATWTESDALYTFTWTKSGDDYVSLFTAFGGTSGGELDWSEGTNIHLQRGTLTNGPFYISIVANDKTFKRGLYSGGSAVDLTLTATSGDGFTKNGWGASYGYITKDDLAHITDIRIEGNTTNEGSIVLSNIFVQLSPKATLDFNSSGIATIDLADIDISGSTLSYNSSTGEVISTGSSGTIFLTFNNANFTNVTQIIVSANVKSEEGYTDICNTSDVINSAGNSVNDGPWYGSKYGMTFNDTHRANSKEITTIRWNVNAVGTMKINSITITANAMALTNARDVAISALPHYRVAADGTVSRTSDIATYYGSEVDTQLGDGSSLMDEYIDISDFDELRIYTSDKVRVFFFNANPIVAEVKDGETVTVKGTYKTDGATAYTQGESSNPFSYNNGEGYYYVSVSDIKAAFNGHAKVIGVKGASYGAKATVSKIQVIKDNPTYDYILSGQYSSSTDISAFTSDVSARTIDCANLSGNNLSVVTSSNPNCLFVANSGVLSNTANVIVSGACAQLALTDNKPFKAPAAFSATAAPTYDRA